jgi:hypothetical protein
MNSAFHHWLDEQRQRREAAALERQLRTQHPQWFAEAGQGVAETPPAGISEPPRAQRMRFPGRSDWES